MKYISTCMLIATFIIVVCVLAPMGFTVSIAFGFELLVGNANLFHHFLCPIIGTWAFLKVDRSQQLTIRNNLLALLPTIVYSGLVLWANIVGILYGPYPFLHIYEQSILTSIIWVIVIWSTIYAIAYLLRWFNKKFYG